MAVSAVVADWSGARYVNGSNESLEDYMTKEKVESNMNTADYKLKAFELNAENGVTVGYKGKDYNFTVEITSSGNSAKVIYEGEGEPTEVTEWIENEDGSVTNGEVTLQVGDYINYDPITGASKISETSYATETGYSTDQVFNLADYTGKWKIFGVENGKILIISEGEIIPSNQEGKKYYLAGKEGLKNAIIELDKISALYGQGKYAESARSVNHKDIADLIGLTPEVYNDFCDTVGSEIDKYGNEVSIFWDGTVYPRYESTLAGNGSMTSAHDGGFCWYDFETEEMKKINYTTTPSEESIITIINNFYGYEPGYIDLEIPNNIYKMVFVNSTGYYADYWLASRCSLFLTNSAMYCVYSVRERRS